MSSLLSICPKNAVGQILARTDVAPPDHYSGGLPFDADGVLAVQAGNPDYYHQGLGFTNSSRLAVSGDAVLYWGSGAAGFQVDARLCRVLQAPDHYSSGVGYDTSGKNCQVTVVLSDFNDDFNNDFGGEL